ncbi:MAG: uracil-DNA glycosylase family protein [Muribaculaceae bacterium]|nr:uracil-DNA glycosylase family protein [Muribaculaceae bacterium]
MTTDDIIPLETHPWEAFIPEGAKVLIMGTFPPPPNRWSMNFYYPNRTNDFWPAMSLIFHGDRNALNAKAGKGFDIDAIKQLLTAHHIALSDTGHKIRRLAGNASDKFLEIVEPVNLHALLERMPLCRTVVTTGEKAAGVVAAITETAAPAMGLMTEGPDGLEIWRMPSTSRAYPLALEKKAEYYERMFRHAGII